MNDQTLEDLSERLRTSLRTCSDVQLIVIKENRSKTMTLTLPYRDIWECPLDREITDFEMLHHYGILTGVVQFEPERLSKKEKVFVEVMARCKYEKEELDPFDLSINRIEYHDFRQIYPVVTSNMDNTCNYPLVIKKLITKFGPNSYKFRFDLRHGPDSIRYYDYNDAYFQNGVKWTVRLYISKDLELDTPRDGISIEFRKLSFLWTDITSLNLNTAENCERGYRSCCLDGGRMELDAQISKQIYYYGQPIPVRVSINNLSDRVVRGVRITCEQSLTFSNWTDRTDSRRVAQVWITGEEMRMPLLPGRNWSELRVLRPGTAFGETFFNLVVETPPKLNVDTVSPRPISSWRDCCLAASTINHHFPRNKDTENVNIQPDTTNVFYSDPCMRIKYDVVVMCDIQGSCPLSTPLLSVRIPFVLAHPYPEVLSGLLMDAKLIV